jgi:hypothetical protein
MLEPNKEYTWPQLDEISGKSQHPTPMLGVWHFGVLTYLAHVAQQRGSHVVVVEQLPYRAFRFFPVLTTLYFFGFRAGLWNVLLSSLRIEARMVRTFLKTFPTCVPQNTSSKRSGHERSESEDLWEKWFCDAHTTSTRFEVVPTFDTLTQFLDHEYVCLVQLNGYALDGEPGYGGHMVLVVGYTEAEIIIHNPRLPGSAYRHYSRDIFLTAWYSPYTHCANLYAVKIV